MTDLPSRDPARGERLLESITDAFFALDPAWRFTYVNGQAERLLARPRGALLGQVVWDAFPEAVGSTFWSEYHRAVRERERAVFEEFFPPLGRWFSVHAYPSEEGLSVFFTDVTESKRAERALRETEERYRFLADTLPQLVWTTDPEGYHDYYNRRWFEYTGRSMEETEGEGWNAILHPEDRERAWARWRHSLRTGEPYSIEYRFRRHDGAYRWFLGQALPQRDAEGRITRWVGTCTDIDDERRAREALAESEERLRFLSETIPAHVWTARPDGRLDYVSRRTAAYFGIPAERILGEGWQERVHPDDLAASVERWTRALETGEPYETEFRLRRQDGAFRWHLSRAQAMTGAGGEVMHWFGVNTDVDDARRAEEERDRALAEARTERGRLREVFARAPALIVVTRGPEHRVEMANPGYRTLVGGRELEGRPVREAIPELEGQGFFELLDEVYATGEPFVGNEIPARVDRGRGEPEEGFFNFVYQALRGAQGAVEGVLAFAVEVTAQVRARREVERLEERLRLALDSASIGTWDFDLAAGTLAWDERCRRIFGLAPEDAVDYTVFLSCLHPDDRPGVDAAVRHALDPAGSGEYEVDFRAVHPDGCVRWVRARGRGFFDGAGPGRRAVRFTGTVLDVTEPKRAEEEREAAIASRSRFYAAMSHELRTPINAVLGYNDLLLAGVYGPLEERQEEGLMRAQRAARHLLHLVGDVLDISKLEAGKMELVPETVSVPALVHDLLATLRPLAEERGSELRVVREEEVPEVRTDPRRVQQILLNLASNALKFGRGRPVEVRLRAGKGGGAVVEVADQGVGIPPDDLERVFEEFVQLPNANEGGTGLGLPISRALAELLGATLSAESGVGEGSVFRLALPADLPVRG